MEDEVNTVRELILRNKRPSYQTTNHKEVRVRCPYCGDSKKDANSAHMYIEMQPPFRFHCFKCETSGVLNQQTLRDLGIYDNDLNVSVINANKSFKSIQGVQKISYKKRNLKNQAFHTQASQNAVNYFNNRFGSNFSEEDLVENFKCITDAIEFFKLNNISVQNNFDFSKSIGFLSSDSAYIIFRDISGQQSKRYSNLNLCPDISTISKTYNIKSDIDLMTDEVNLVITEGIFDIIGVYTHFYQDKKQNTIFAAACGKGYNAVILNYLRMGFLNLNITIYSDADVDISFYKKLKENSPYLSTSRITIFYNNKYNPLTGYGKDYGVKKEDIELRRAVI